MKKIFKMLAAALVLAGSFFVTSCDDVKDIINIPENKWCMMDIGYKAEEGTTQESPLTVNFYYTEVEKEVARNVKFEPGLHIVITAQSNGDGVLTGALSGLTDKTYIHKFYPPSGVVEKDGEEDSNSLTFKGDYSTWSMIYLAKKELRHNQSDYAPKQVSSGTELSAETVADALNWKHILADYLLR